MTDDSRSLPDAASTWRVVLVGIVGLAAAIGIGRFGFTPLLPLMQAEGGLPLAAGGWLAAANYAGHLAGALACMLFTPGARTTVRGGLVAVALSTAGMGLVQSLAPWLLLRFIAGAAGAMVLVGVSQWALVQLARSGRAQAAGGVYAGVGVGIVLAGLGGLEAALHSRPSSVLWLVFGAAAAVAAAGVWPSLAAASNTARPSAAAIAQRPRIGTAVLVFAYGAFGYGYIIPATFLPAIAREQFADPRVFGWVWPAFGLAAALSTVVAARWLRRLPPRHVWIGGQLVMALGVAAPALSRDLGHLLFAAVCIGGTFMVVTMAAMQEAQRLAAAHAGRLMAAMTASFGLGQLVGPLTVSVATGAAGDALVVPSWIAAAVLVAGAGALALQPTRRAQGAPASNSHLGACTDER
jgi:MFS family permease